MMMMQFVAVRAEACPRFPEASKMERLMVNG